MRTLILLLAAALAPAIAQQQLDNEAILKLVKAGLGEEMIVSMVKSQPGNYDTSTDAIIALKQAGVTDKVLQAMVTKGQAPSQPPTAAPAVPATAPVAHAASSDACPAEIGVYYKKGEKWTEVLPEVVNWKTGGVFKSIATAGIVKGDVNGRVNGASSRNTVRTPLEFCVYAAEGVAITEYQLLRLREHKDGREFRTVTGGVLHQSGGATRDLIPFEGKKIASRMYSVTLPNVGSGEYGFLAPGSFSSSHASAQLGKMYTFHLLE